MTQFVIPYPPSVNGLFATVGRKRVKSRAYKDWIEAAGWEIRRQGVPLHQGRVRVEFDIGEPNDRRLRDGDNLLKPMLDLMVSCGVIVSDDRFTVRGGKWDWVQGVEGVRVTVRAA